MYAKVILTLLLVAMTGVAAGLWRRPPAAPVVPAPLSVAEVKLRARLSVPVDLRGVTRQQAVEKLRKATGADIVVHWREVTHSGTDKDVAAFRSVPLDVELKDVPLWAAIDTVLGEGARYQAEDTQIVVSGTSKLSQREMVIRVYDVRDLISDAYWGVASPADRAASIAAERMEIIQQIVFEHAASGSWYSSPSASLFSPPSGNARISTCGGHLVVTQSTSAHREIRALLAELRRSRASLAR